MPDSSGQPGATGDVRLTYQELGERLRISAEAARILTRRRGWRRLAPNRRGAPAIVVVPEDELDAEDWRPDQGAPPDEDRRHAWIPLRVDLAEQRAVEAGQRADAAPWWLPIARWCTNWPTPRPRWTAERLEGDALRQQLVRTDARSDAGSRTECQGSTRARGRIAGRAGAHDADARARAGGGGGAAFARAGSRRGPAPSRGRSEGEGAAGAAQGGGAEGVGMAAADDMRTDCAARLVATRRPCCVVSGRG